MAAVTGGMGMPGSCSDALRRAHRAAARGARAAPGIGPKSAQRLAYHILGRAKAARRLAEAIVEVKETVHFCSRCFNFAEGELCEVCADPERDQDRSVWSRSRAISWRSSGRASSAARTTSCRERSRRSTASGRSSCACASWSTGSARASIKEVIVATNPNVEGETTALYIARLLKPLGVRVTRIASGLPVGGDLEYADEVTLGRALEARREM